MDDVLDPSRQIPITVLTGFLGVGKTTLLSHLLKHPEMRRSAVIINEFGQVPLDHELVETAVEDIVEVSGGCLCCTVRGDLSRAIRSLDLRRRRDKVLPFERLLIETTGLADPAPIVHTLISDPIITHGYRLDGVVTLVDAVNGVATLGRHPEAVKQVALADRVVVTKTSLTGQVIPASLRTRLSALNPIADAAIAELGKIDLLHLLDLGPWHSRERRPDIDRWLGKAAIEGHANHHLGHNPNRHDGHIRAFCLRHTDPVPAAALGLFLEILMANASEDLLRVKGIVHLLEDPERPLVLQVVQHMVHEPVVLDGWPSTDRDTRIVCIGRDLDETMVTQMLDCLARGSR